jgi:hypothetical protein
MYCIFAIGLRSAFYARLPAIRWNSFPSRNIHHSFGTLLYAITSRVCKMRGTDDKVACANIITLRTIGQNRSAVSLDRSALEWVTPDDDTLRRSR